MKKNRTLVLTVTMLALSLGTQAINPKTNLGKHTYTTTCGFKTGYARSSIPTVSHLSGNRENSYFGGVFMAMEATNGSTVLLEFLYVPTKTTKTWHDLQVSFTYLQIPILLHQHITQKWYCDFGPEINILLDAQQEFVEMVWNSETETYDAEYFTEDGFQVTSNYLSLCLGFSYQPTRHFILSARGSWGLDLNLARMSIVNQTVARCSLGYIL